MNPPYPPLIDRVLYTEEQIEQRIREVAAAISQRYRDRNLKLIGVLKGSVFFLTALARQLDIPVRVDYLAISSFSASKSSPGVVRIAKDLDEPIEGDDILVVEDIVDTGLTLRYLLQTLAGRGPADNACTTAAIPAQGCLPAPRRRSVADHPQTLQTPTARYNRRHGNLATRRPGTRSTAAAGNRLPAARVNGRVRQRFSRHRNGTERRN